MEIEIHPEILKQQRFSCNCCGRGCRSFLVSLSRQECDSIESRQDWRKFIKTDEFFLKTPSAKPTGWGLAKFADGRCVFLDDHNLCQIHKLYGLTAKPKACQLYPFTFTGYAGRLRIGLRFDCLAVCRNEGTSLDSYRRELDRLAREMVPQTAGKITVPPIGPGRKTISPARFDAVNETLIEIVNTEGLNLLQRLHWLQRFIAHLAKVRWNNINDDDFPVLLNMFKDSLLTEVQRRHFQPQPVFGRPRKVLGQVFFLLSHPTTIICRQLRGFRREMKDRLDNLRAMRRLAYLTGPLPAVQPTWPAVDLADLEKSFGPWPPPVQQMLTRYLTCRLGSVSYCGPNFYNYSLMEGARWLLLALITVGWLMRIAALQAGRGNIELADAHTAVMTIDGNMGYGTSMGGRTGRMRLNFLKDHLEQLIDWYCA